MSDNLSFRSEESYCKAIAEVDFVLTFWIILRNVLCLQLVLGRESKTEIISSYECFTSRKTKSLPEE